MGDEGAAALQQARERWLSLALSCDPIDFPAARAALAACYTAIGLSPPAQIVWVLSPLEGAIVSYLLHAYTNHRRLDLDRMLLRQQGGHLLDRLWPQWRNQLEVELERPVTRAFGAIRAENWLFPGRRPMLGGAVRVSLDTLTEEMIALRLSPERIGAAVAEATGGGRRERARWRGQVWDLINLRPSGCFPVSVPQLLSASAVPDLSMPEMAGLCAAAEALDGVGVELEATTRAQVAWGRAGGWCWTFHDLAVASLRPVRISLDDFGRLHDPQRSAVEFADGFGLWAWHGMRVPESLIDPGWDGGTALTTRDAEVRRCAIEKMGWDALVESAELRLLGPTVPDPGNPGQRLALYEVPHWARERGRLLVARNGTPTPDGERHTFGLWVPREMRDPIEAAAWTYGIDPGLYRAAQRRA